ncbi:MAG: CPBP family intramembrane metalloprotease [Acidobacteria bacterium]|nr:CPBP family intramembrane metalloprotease [Acidobacteriota bacterium]
MNGTRFLYAEDGRLRAIWRFALSVIVFYLALNLAPFVATPLRNHSLLVRELVSRSVLTILLAGAFSLLLVTLDGVDGSPLAAMGLAFGGSAVRDSVVGFVFGGVMVALAVMAIAVRGKFSAVLNFGPASWKLLAEVTAVLAVAAMSEELAFRGYPFQRLVEAIGAIGATIITSGIFAAGHLANPHATAYGVLNTAAVGVLFCLAYLRTRSLWLPWGMHLGWNFTLGVLFGLPVSGLSDFAVVVHGAAAGPVWLTGGGYGIEASATGTAVITLGIIVVGLLFRRPPVTQPEFRPANPQTS